MQQFIVSLLLLIYFVCGIPIYDYNKVDFEEKSSIADLLESTFTSDGKAIRSVVIGLSTPQCSDRLERAAFRGSQRHAGGETLSSVSVVMSSEEDVQRFPLRLNDCAEYFFYLIDSQIEDPNGRSTLHSNHELNSFIADHTRVSVRVMNKFNFPVDMYWSEENLEPRLDANIKAGDDLGFNSFLGHVFVFMREGTQEVVDYMAIDGRDYTARPQNHLQTCDVGLSEMHHLDGSSASHIGSGAGMGTFTHGGVIDCEDMYTRYDEFAHRVWYGKRLGLNFVQPQLVQSVTENGFELRQLPEETYSWLKAWYDRSQMRHAVAEENVGPCMNQRAAASEVTHLPALGTFSKSRLSRELRETLEEWYGGELVMTSIYGVRKYTNGSVLRMHVDTANTHVVSAIINVDQEIDVASGDRDWPLLILDHDGKEHNLVMAPGDLVLYESAKLLHGRPTVFHGTSYSNIFIHYAPKDWDAGFV